MRSRKVPFYNALCWQDTENGLVGAQSRDHLIRKLFKHFVNRFNYRSQGLTKAALDIRIEIMRFMEGAKRNGSLILGAVLVLTALLPSARGQIVVDKTVATVSDGLRTELITLSDLKWELALQRGVPISPPSSNDLKAALATLTDQRIFSLDADRIPRPEPTEREIEAEIKRLLGVFPTTAEFERRLRAVGFNSVRDDNFEALISKRLAIEKYIDFRFRSFVVNTPEEVSRHYNENFVPEFRRRFPGVLMPTLEEKRNDIEQELTEDKVQLSIEAFLDDAKRRVQVVILNEV